MDRKPAEKIMIVSGNRQIYDTWCNKFVLEVNTSWRATREQDARLINRLYCVYLEYIQEIMDHNNGEY